MQYCFWVIAEQQEEMTNWVGVQQDDSISLGPTAMRYLDQPRGECIKVCKLLYCSFSLEGLACLSSGVIKFASLQVAYTLCELNRVVNHCTIETTVPVQ